MGSLWTQSSGDFQILLRSDPSLFFSECVLCLSLSGLYMLFPYGALLSSPTPSPVACTAFVLCRPYHPHPMLPVPSPSVSASSTRYTCCSFLREAFHARSRSPPSLPVTLAKTLLHFLSHFKCISPCVKWRYWIVSSLKTHISIIFVSS